MPSSLELADIRQGLRKAAIDCSERGLVQSAKWAAEQLNHLSQDSALGNLDDMPSMSSSADTVPSGVASGNETASKANAAHLLQDQAEQDQFLLGKALFDARQYERAAYYLENCAGPKATFLRLYSLYLAGEKRKNEKLAEFRDAHERPKIVNDMASEIRDELAKNRDKLDGFGLYLLGLIYSNQKSRLARDVLLESVKTYPYNWSAWQCLAVCLNTRELVEGFMPRLPQGIMRHVFLAHVTVESPPSSIDSGDLFNLHYQVLRQVFPTSPFVISMQAMRHYHTREFEEAHAVFSELEERDPYHLDHADIHSNILYVMEDRPQLGTLAHRCSVIDVYRPETCCVIGNYYSLRREHEKAVMYFQRALRLDRSYLSAWTLMGHEYMELKNTSAAIQAYRRAVEVDERDYRAWYGLGQTYEMLKQPQYAFYYFKRAVALRPFDSRMWCALANCYEMSNELGNAIASYQRALSGSQESEHIAIVRLGKLYSQVGKPDTAAYYYKMFYDRAQSEELDPEEVSNAALFLASYYQERGRIDQVEKYLKEVIDLQSSRQEEAKAMLRAIASSSRASAMGTSNSVGARPANRMQMS